VLLEHGLEPNERIDVLPDAEFEGATELNKYIGFAPIQILAAAAIDAFAKQQATEQDNSVDASLMMKVFGDLGAAAVFLVQNGARLNLEPPPLSRRLSRSSSPSMQRSSSASDESDDVFRVDRSLLKLDASKQLLQFLGGEDLLIAAKKAFSALQPVPMASSVALLNDRNVTLEDSAAPGGSDEKSCAICWKTFGALVNRKHKCQVTRRFLCDECSSKRIIDHGEEVRLSDGQFLLACVEAAKEEGDRKQSERERLRIQQVRAEKAELRVRRLEAEEDTNRETLFGGVMDMATNLVFGDDDKKDDRQMTGLSQSLGETRNALVERGSKLETLGEKTSRLADASRDFAQMAKELSKESQKGGMFW
jgi:DNA-directed RNA polymerase subunit RPC12/RpoP